MSDGKEKDHTTTTGAGVQFRPTAHARTNTFARIDPKSVKKPDDGRTIKGRVKFTTMLHPGLRAQLNAVALSQQVSVADVLDTIIREYFDLTPEQVAKMTPPAIRKK